MVADLGSWQESEHTEAKMKNAWILTENDKELRQTVIWDWVQAPKWNIGIDQFL